MEYSKSKFAIVSVGAHSIYNSVLMSIVATKKVVLKKTYKTEFSEISRWALFVHFSLTRSSSQKSDD